MSNKVEDIVGSRIYRIVIYLIAAMLLSLVALWLWQGGYQAVARYAGMIPTPLESLTNTSTTTYDFVLPGQMEFPTVPDTFFEPGEEGYDIAGAPSAEDRLYDIEARYGQIEKDVHDLQTFGESSPYRGMVRLSRGHASESDVSREYLVLTADPNVQTQLSLAGWSLQSQLTGTRIAIPLAASPMQQGIINSVQPIALRGGEEVVLVSGGSPVGVSFKENICTGYLSQMQEFEPALSNSCPAPRDAMPLTLQNLQKYGEECVDYVATIPQCNYPSELPATLSPACRTFVANTFSHNGCVSAFRLRVPFTLGTWRAYAGSGVELWRNTHDAIRLLDDKGRTVDALVY
jgi:hypothetical protein